MATVSFKRTNNVDAVPITDGQVLFDTENYRIFVDNGTERLQYGGEVEIIQKPYRANASNVFSSKASLDTFVQRTSVVDSRNAAFAVTQEHVPVGCLAFKDVVEQIEDKVDTTLAEASDTINSSLVTPDGAHFFFDYQDGEFGFNTDKERGADTFFPFKRYVLLGEGTRFDVSMYRGYEKFTTTNFVCQPNNAGLSSNFGPNGGGGHNVGFWGITGGGTNLTKSYDPKTGILTAYQTVSASCGINSESTGRSATAAVRTYLLL